MRPPPFTSAAGRPPRPGPQRAAAQDARVQIGEAHRGSPAGLGRVGAQPDASQALVELHVAEALDGRHERDDSAPTHYF